MRTLTYSIVSHGQLHLIRNLLSDLRSILQADQRIVLVLNIPEDETCLTEFSDLPLTVLRNASPQGFGANHNLAFNAVPSDTFVIVNPDIRLPAFDVSKLTVLLEATDVGAVAPAVFSSTGTLEDSARRFPSIWRLIARRLPSRRGSDYAIGTTPIDVDWSAGMFVAFNSKAFKLIGGFDDKFFMYMEDADICRRLKRQGWRTVVQPSTSVIHDAQRASRRNYRHLRWHLSSAFRFLFLPPKNLVVRESPVQFDTAVEI